MRSKKLYALLVAALTILSLAGVQTVAQAEPPSRKLKISETKTTENWNGDVATGSNIEYDPAAGKPCVDTDGGAHPEYCDISLVHVDLPASFWESLSGGVEVRLDNYFPNPGSDFDLYIYKSNANGDQGPFVTSSADLPGSPENTVITEARGYYLIKVVYFAVTSSRYEGHLELFFRHREPPDVDRPAGLQEILASNARAGWKSRSEPHIAVNPLNPRMLIAGSKFYNKDRDSLEEYEFKIGTYASFNGGRTWYDLGQLDTGTCRATQSDNEGANAWPNNVCYPPDKPKVGGTGPEDVRDREDPEDAFDNRGSGDYGEEYIVSDPWIQWDDEGNAYIMVLDAPPFESEVGWGMTMHIWNSVSAADLRPGGRTWSHRKPINAYPEDFPRDFFGFLDDKNTFAVNNAGPNREDLQNQTNIMIACWGQNVSAAIKQQEVCERSPPVGGGGRMGEDWSGEPVPVSSAHQLVIGIHVVADKTNPLTFYVTYLQYETSIPTSEATLEFGRTDDGGVTWTSTAAPVVVDVFDDIPRQFPRQSFRNLSIPIMAVGEDPDGSGGSPAPLYIVIAEYVPAPRPAADEDDQTSDIFLYKSVDGGATWDRKNITNGHRPNRNADQFQPAIDVTEEGQVNVTYFDRRQDVPAENHPGNYFVDTYLARSNNGGETFSYHRVSHDASDPEFNAPISGSGKFYGDYQGLVADDCVAIPFVNDTHLANDQYLDPGPTRDPEFDSGLRSLPDVKYQQVINWRVPNSVEFGGTKKPDLRPDQITVEDAPVAGQETRLAARIRNRECIDALNVVVEFRDNGQLIGRRTIPFIAGNDVRHATVPWTPSSPGRHVITVTADPQNAIAETNENNNTEAKTYQVERSGG